MVSQTIFVTCAIAIALALVGVAAVVREALRRRLHEFGIRLALGAQPAALVRLVVRDATKLGFIGATAGGVLSMILLLTVGASMVRDCEPSGAGSGGDCDDCRCSGRLRPSLLVGAGRGDSRHCTGTHTSDPAGLIVLQAGIDRGLVPAA